MAGGTAGDLITCRPFDASLELFNKGNLAPLNDLKGMANFSDVAKSAWTTDDGKTTFCLPMASVIHGFIYNKDALKKVGASEPKTMEEFYALLDKLKKDGTYVPLVLGTADQWESATMGFQNIGPNYWKGEEGRNALIKGTQKLTDAPYVATFKELAKWGPYLGSGYQAQTYPDSQNMFSLGKGAIYAAGSWDISTFRAQGNIPLGAFKAPPPAGQSDCYISDHTDIGIGLNAASKNAADARVFLDWMATSEFAEIFANSLPGFFPLSNANRRSAIPIRSSRAERRTSKTSCGTSRHRSSMARCRLKMLPSSSKPVFKNGISHNSKTIDLKKGRALALPFAFDPDYFCYV